MGVFGLLSHCLRNKDQCAEYVDLIGIAKQQNGIEILVDFYSFEHFLLQNFWKSLCLVTNNEFLPVTGGEYASLDGYVTKFVTDLASLGIRLVFYIDGAKGSSHAGTRQKFETWVQRHHRDCRNMTDILDVCVGRKQISNIPEQALVRPVLLEVQILGTLRQCQCEIIQCCAGEADPVIAKDLLQRPKAYAILSNDSDFCVVRDCRLIPHQLFDLQNDMHLGEAIPYPEKPMRLCVGVLNSASVCQMLGFKQHSLLIEMAILAGNDATSQTVKTLKHRIDLRGNPSDCRNIAGWIMHYKKVENHPVIADEMRRNPQFTDAVHMSRLFYELKQPGERPAEKGPQSACIIENVRQGKFPPHVLAMHHNFYWHRMLLEDSTSGQPCAEIALSELRGYLYRMLLNKNEAVVTEYGRTAVQEFQSMTTYAVQDPSHFKLLPLHYIHAEKVFPNLRMIHNIMSHQEPDEMKWFDRYGRRNGFLCYVLRYMLVLNTGRHLYIEQDEFLSLVAAAFANVHEDNNESQTIPLRPPVRCVTIGNWFQDVYRHAYEFLAKMLHLSHEFPQPKEIFSGSLWTAFYVLARQQVHECCATQPSYEQLDRIWNQRQHIIKEKRHMIRYLVKDIFQFDDRY